MVFGLPRNTRKEAEIKTRWFGTTIPALRELQNWLREEGCTTVALESAGSWWISVKNELETDLTITLVCHRKHHPKKGDKTARSDPPAQETAGRRRGEDGQRTSDVFGVSGQEILQALLKNKPLKTEQLVCLNSVPSQVSPSNENGVPGSRPGRGPSCTLLESSKSNFAGHNNNNKFRKLISAAKSSTYARRHPAAAHPCAHDRIGEENLLPPPMFFASRIKLRGQTDFRFCFVFCVGFAFRCLDRPRWDLFPESNEGRLASTFM